MMLSAAWQRTAPPTHVTVEILGRGLGILGDKKQGGQSSGQSPQAQDASPQAIQMFLGQEDVPTYQRPRKGLTVEGASNV
jgi:hypothetical protein